MPSGKGKRPGARAEKRGGGSSRQWVVVLPGNRAPEPADPGVLKEVAPFRAREGQLRAAFKRLSFYCLGQPVGARVKAAGLRVSLPRWRPLPFLPSHHDIKR